MVKVVVQLTDDDGEPTGEVVPPGNDRMWRVTLHNRGRVKVGTMAIHRLTALFFGLRKRYPRLWKSSQQQRGDKPILFRKRIGGELVARVEVLDGPVASRASKH